MIVYIDIHTFTVQIYKKNSYSFAFLSFFRIFADDSNKEQMKKIFILLLMTFVAVIVQAQVLDIKEMPKTAVRQPDAYFQHAVYINIDKPASAEGEMDAVCSVWLADERAGTVVKVCVTNPNAEARWMEMNSADASAIDVPITQIAAADKAMLTPGDVSKVIVEGCPDGRNIWTYIIDPDKGTAKQLPSSEGVLSLDWENKEIIAASYGYDDEGRYSFKKAYSLDGRFLRIVGEKERE